MSFGSKIKEIRNKMELTQAEFAEAIGCGQTAVSQYEIGQRRPSYKIAKAIISLAKAKKIKVTLMDIFPDE